MKFIQHGTVIINVAQLVEADYMPGVEGSCPTSLKLRFAVPQSEARTNFDGDYVGCDEAEPYFRQFKGKDAEDVWQKLEALCQ